MNLFSQIREVVLFFTLGWYRFTPLLKEEYPNLPIYTIHDSIATTSGNERIVETIMIEELTKHIGIPPTLKFDLWTHDSDFTKVSNSGDVDLPQAA